MAKEIFDAAVEGEEEDVAVEQIVADAADPKTEAPAAKEEPKGEQPKGEPEAAPPQEPPPPPQPHQVPLSELLNTRERAQSAERERDELKRALEHIQRQQQQAQQKPAEVPDIFSDPEAYTRHINETVHRTTTEMRLEFDMQLAEVRHPDVFPKAYDAFIQAVGNPGRPNPQLYHEVMGARSPGQAIVDWFKRDQVLREVGTDPAAYRQKLQQELLNDQEFIAQVIAKTRGDAGNGSRPTNVTRLPSLNRQTSAANSKEADDNDGSPEGIWGAATR
jgi:outer membrane biosynthesis protein TonB